MFKRIFWMGLGVTAGVVLVTKAEAYVRANTPKRAREFVLGEDQDQVASRTLSGLVRQFTQTMHQRQDELGRRYLDRFQG
ncbi:hypothetical protein J3T92_04070 [Bifidobacterium sp. B4081]|uniref:hypothetical protein n=1 Tax=unclassified Bifidobacterium TaxID=2608897 RepID=UPI00226A3124|nr:MULTISPECIES: hypothetical protein [unclassified Bifidobacterium]MCX8643604.1 hypothetical protein [Bifidobacterium sp. B4077]MCX8645786.1 hypothetical protein [Bifidobacterium sp. B4081]MCX8647445.1 hypothetical protein [Bifidobacterium sp. B4107]MCX8651625.1 hypothetical protein [Bifidobacterium sp. B4111]MCX8658056.1 hypothetical protein [Bifidobacterium sp. B4114]